MATSGQNDDGQVSQPRPRQSTREIIFFDDDEPRQSTRELFDEDERQNSSAPLRRSSVCQIFINHTGRDESAAEFAGFIASTLETKYHLNVFLDTETIEPGDIWRPKIQENAMHCELLVAIISPHYFERFWCLHELDLALCHKRIVIPVFCGLDVENIPSAEDPNFVNSIRRMLSDKGLVDERLSSVVLDRWLRNLEMLDGTQGHTVDERKHWMKRNAEKVAYEVHKRLTAGNEVHERLTGNRRKYCFCGIVFFGIVAIVIAIAVPVSRNSGSSQDKSPFPTGHPTTQPSPQPAPIPTTPVRPSLRPTSNPTTNHTPGPTTSVRPSIRPAPNPTNKPSMQPTLGSSQEQPAETMDDAGNLYGVHRGPVTVFPSFAQYQIVIKYLPLGITVDYPSRSCGNNNPITPSLVSNGQLQWTETIDYGNCDSGTSYDLAIPSAGGAWQLAGFPSSGSLVGLSMTFEACSPCP